jgi:hypothetical protein
MESPTKLTLAVSVLWLVSRLSVVILTPFFFGYSCDNDLPTFLKLIFYSTIFTVGLQLAHIIYMYILKKKSAKPLKSIQLIYFILDYIFYGLFRFVVFILGLVWVIESEHCDDMIWYYSIALCAGYFLVCWSVCWVGFAYLFILCWDAQTL